MRVSNDVHKFTSACERLLADMVIHRPLTQDEVLLVKHYCHEVIRKIDQPAIHPEQVAIPLSE